MKYLLLLTLITASYAFEVASTNCSGDVVSTMDCKNKKMGFGTTSVDSSMEIHGPTEDLKTLKARFDKAQNEFTDSLKLFSKVVDDLCIRKKVTNAGGQSVWVPNRSKPFTKENDPEVYNSVLAKKKKLMSVANEIIAYKDANSSNQQIFDFYAETRFKRFMIMHNFQYLYTKTFSCYYRHKNPFEAGFISLVMAGCKRDKCSKEALEKGHDLKDSYELYKYLLLVEKLLAKNKGPDRENYDTYIALGVLLTGGTTAGGMRLPPEYIDVERGQKYLNKTIDYGDPGYLLPPYGEGVHEANIFLHVAGKRIIDDEGLSSFKVTFNPNFYLDDGFKKSAIRNNYFQEEMKDVPWIQPETLSLE